MSWKIVPQPRICSSKASVSIAAVDWSDDTSLSWQNTADDNLRQRPADSRRPGMLEPYQTVPSRSGWPSWNPPSAKPKANAAPVAPVLYGHSVERRKPTAQLHSVQTAACSSDRPWCRRKVSYSSPGDMKWTPGPASWRRQMTQTWRAAGATVVGSSHCDTWWPPGQTASAGCQRWRRAYLPSPRRWYVPTPPERLKRWLSPAAAENPTTSPGSWWGLVEVGWPSVCQQ